MNALNSILIEGVVLGTPLTRETPKGSLVCTFDLSSSRTYKQDNSTEEEVSVFNIETWGKLAEYSSNEIVSGRGVRVVGRLKKESGIDVDGKEYSKIKVVAEHIEYKPKFKERLTT